jgi:hypothetical protein
MSPKYGLIILGLAAIASSCADNSGQARSDSNMKTLVELIDHSDPGFVLVKDWINVATVPVEILPPSDQRNAVLLDTQVTTRSPMGAIAYETGGILIDGGWIRILGSGHERLRRTLPGWNKGRAEGFYLIADDVAGGFFAINGGAFGTDKGMVYYWPPDNLHWEPLGFGYSQFLVFVFSDRIEEFYRGLRWDTWRDDIKDLSGDKCFSFYPFLWTKEGAMDASRRAVVPVDEAYSFKMDAVRQISNPKEIRSR